MTTVKCRVGQAGEQMASEHLQNHGFSILDRNYRCRLGEVDIIAEKDQELVFVEVRTRRSRRFGTALESLTPAKLRHLVAASQHYLAQHSLLNRDWRIDLVAIDWPGGSAVPGIDHLEYAVGLA